MSTFVRTVFLLCKLLSTLLLHKASSILHIVVLVKKLNVLYGLLTKRAYRVRKLIREQ